MGAAQQPRLISERNQAGTHLWPECLAPLQRRLNAVPLNLAPHVVQHRACDAAPAERHHKVCLLEGTL